MKELSGDEMNWTDGMLYPVLHRLEKQGYISSYWQKSESGRKRKYYSLTGEGRENLENFKSQWRLVNSTLTRTWNQSFQIQSEGGKDNGREHRHD